MIKSIYQFTQRTVGHSLTGATVRSRRGMRRKRRKGRRSRKKEEKERKEALKK